VRVDGESLRNPGLVKEQGFAGGEAEGAPRHLAVSYRQGGRQTRILKVDGGDAHDPRGFLRLREVKRRFQRTRPASDGPGPSRCSSDGFRNGKRNEAARGTGKGRPASTGRTIGNLRRSPAGVCTAGRSESSRWWCSEIANGTVWDSAQSPHSGSKAKRSSQTCPMSRRKSRYSMIQSTSGRSACGAPQQAPADPVLPELRRGCIGGGGRAGSRLS